MGWLFGDRTRVDKPPVVDRKVIAFPVVKKSIPVKDFEPSKAAFTDLPFGSVDEVLWKARADLRRGLIDAAGVMVILYDKQRENVVWYQYGRENDDVDAAFHAWIDEIMS